MLINSKILEEKINQYINNIITKKELGFWSMQAYYTLIKGEYIEIDKLSVYHFLRTISTFHMEPNDIADEYPCSEEEVLNIRDILCGSKDINYTFNIKIFKNIFKNEKYESRIEVFNKLSKAINEIPLNNMAQLELNELKDYVSQDIDKIESLIDLLECHMKGIIVENIDFEDKIIDYRQSVGIYVGGTDNNKENFLPNLKKMLDCVMGDMFFRVSIIYKNGVSSLSIVLL